MIVVTITAPDDQQYVVRYQGKIEKDHEMVWADNEVHTFIGTSQAYAIDKGAFRIIVEDPDGIPLNAVA